MIQSDWIHIQFMLFFQPWTTSREPTKYPLSLMSFHEKGQMGEPFSAP